MKFYASEEESDDDIPAEKVTSNEEAPNGINPGVPLIPREPDAPAHQIHCMEVEQLVEVAGPPPTHERRQLRAAVRRAEEYNLTYDTSNLKENAETSKSKGQCTYCKALLATEDMHVNNKPTSVVEAKARPDWLKWRSCRMNLIC